MYPLFELESDFLFAWTIECGTGTMKQILHLGFERPCTILLSRNPAWVRGLIGLVEGQRPCEAEISHEAEAS